MPGFHNVLVATDFSDCSKEAMRLGLVVAQRYDAAVTLLHVVELPPYFSTDPAQWLALIAQIVRAAQYALDRLRAAAHAESGLAIASQLVDGYPPVEIVRLCRAGSFDLVTLGAHGHNTLRRALLGSVADHVVRHSPCAVLTVRW